MKLYALYLGGRASRCNIELHDVIFAVGSSLKSLYPTVLDKWFGLKDKCHIDSWMTLKQIDNHAITLSQSPPSNQTASLYFINMGAYQPGEFTELHASAFIVATSP